ncbi:hypothetical protein E2C01_036188 [Portunus trituberculatus]|uniref:Uncharacterized protein n=1 Tax=Portunus trituberculatus TaxID=210409 RepID=A0A5B7FAN5_PORTR|nr:hypothetical protein [Portunus trituberculatus]
MAWMGQKRRGAFLSEEDVYDTNVSIVCATLETHELSLRDIAAATLHCSTGWRSSLLRARSRQRLLVKPC